MYRVRLEGSDSSQRFDFTNYDDAFSFASMAVEHGIYQASHLVKNECGDGYTTVWDDPKPVEVRIVGVEE